MSYTAQLIGIPMYLLRPALYNGPFYYGHGQMDSNISSRYLDNGQQSKFKPKHTTQQHHRWRPHGARYLHDKP